MRMNTSPLNFPLLMVAAASILAAIYSSSPAQARDLVGTHVASRVTVAAAENSSLIISRKTSSAAKLQALDSNRAIDSNLPRAQAMRNDAARRADFARRLFWVMLSMR
ncbi:MAG: hypothetical protein ACLPXB_00280 [Thiobacillaceae bacterium]